jgi:hypothetical protein
VFEDFYAAHRPRKVETMAAWALALSWKQLQADQQDARLMTVYANLRRAAVTTRARMLILSGLAGGQA